jgi:hypothetical protein
MKEQIETAVKWWADQLRTVAQQDKGDAQQSAIATVLAFELGPVAEEQVVRFEVELRKRLSNHLRKSWRPDDPEWGSYNRALACDYGPETILRHAARDAGIEPSCPPFPTKTVMWINPDKVSVACGYGSEPVQLWAEETSR